MSRTYRRDAVELDWNHEPIPHGKIWSEEYWNPRNYYHRVSHYDYYSKRNSKRDIKPWGKSPHWFKNMKERTRRAKVKSAMEKRDYENIPCFRTENDWDWT